MAGSFNTSLTCFFWQWQACAHSWLGSPRSGRPTSWPAGGCCPLHKVRILDLSCFRWFCSLFPSRSAFCRFPLKCLMFVRASSALCLSWKMAIGPVPTSCLQSCAAFWHVFRPFGSVSGVALSRPGYGKSYVRGLACSSACTYLTCRWPTCFQPP